MAPLVKRIEQISLLIAIFAVVIIMVVVSMDAIMRYAFNSPLRWASELVRYYLMVVGIYFAVSSTFTHGDHVNITLFRDKMPDRLRAWIDVIWCLMAAAVFAGIAYGTWEKVTDAYHRVEFIPGYIIWPSWLSYLPIPLGCALIVLRLVHHCIVLARFGKDDDVAMEGEPSE